MLSGDERVLLGLRLRLLERERRSRLRALSGAASEKRDGNRRERHPLHSSYPSPPPPFRNLSGSSYLARPLNSDDGLSTVTTAERDRDGNRSLRPPHTNSKGNTACARDDEAAVELRHRIRRPAHR